MKNLHTYEEFLNENLSNRYKIYKKEIEWKEHRTKNGSYSAKIKNSDLEILSTGYGNWELRIDGKPIMPSETAKEKTAEDNAVKWYDWDRDKVGALMHTAQEMFENFLNDDLNERAKTGLTKTQWSKFSSSNHGDLLLSMRQGVIGIRDGEVLRPIYRDIGSGKPAEIAKDKGFDTDKQFTEIIEPTSASISKAFSSMWPGTSKAVAVEYGKDVEALVVQIINK